MTSFGGYSRSKICGIVQSRRAKSPEAEHLVDSKNSPRPSRFRESTRERLFSLAKKKSSTKKYLYLDRAIGDNNTFFNFSAMDWSLPYRQPFLYRKRSNVPRNKNSPLAIVSRLRENCNPRQRFLQCVFPQL